MTEALFAIFGVLTIFSAIGVVLARSPVYSAFGLILSFFGLSAMYVLWGATFIGMIQILIYTGAIVVLFVFVVMLLNLGKGSGPQTASWLTVLIAGLAVWFFSLILLRSLNYMWVAGHGVSVAHVDDLRKISLLLFNEYLWPFEVLSIFLLALIVAIYALTRPEELEKEEV